MIRARTVAFALAAIAVVGMSAWLTGETQRNRLVWDHFDVVKPGILYRSGQLNPDQLTAAVRNPRYGATSTSTAAPAAPRSALTSIRT